MFVDGVALVAIGNDMTVCLSCGAIAWVVTGSSSVFINGQPVARKTDLIAHESSAQGEITTGSPTVFLGGARFGATTGSPNEAAKLCEQMKTGRVGNSSRQTKENCGIEACRMIIERAGNPSCKGKSESDLLTQSTPARRSDDGRTSSLDQQRILLGSGVNLRTVDYSETVTSPSRDSLASDINSNRGVITAHDTNTFYGGSGSAATGTRASSHSVMVTGIQWGADGTPEEYIVNDTADVNGCGKHVSASAFERSLLPNTPAQVTNKPIWPDPATPASRGAQCDPSPYNPEPRR